MNLKNLLMWALIVLLSIGLFNLFQNPDKMKSSEDIIPFSKFLSEVDSGRVIKVEIQGNNISGILSDGNQFKTYSPNYPNLVEKLSEKEVSIVASPREDKMPSLLGVLLSWFPMLLLIAVWIFFMRQMQGGKGGAMGFGRSKAKLLTEAQGKVTFPFNSFINLALDLPKPMAPPFPPCICLMKNIQTAISNNIGNHDNKTPKSDGILSSKGAAEMLTPLLDNFSIKFG